jgi:hypothetical protein
MDSTEIQDNKGYGIWENSKLDGVQLGKQIKKYRVERGLRQKDLAKRVYSTTNTISRLEIGNTGCSLEMLLAIANALELSPDVLLFGNFNPMFSRFYPYFLNMKDSLSEMFQEAVERIFRDMDKKERLLSVEQDFHEWIENFAAETLGERKTIFNKRKRESENAANTENAANAANTVNAVNTVHAGKAHSLSRSDITRESQPKEKKETESSLEWKAAIGGGKKKSSWLLEEFNKEKRRKLEEEEAVRKSRFLEEIRKEEEKIQKMEEELREAKERLEEKERRENSFYYAAESFLFPKTAVAEEGEREQGGKKEKRKKRVRLPRGEKNRP